MVRFGLEAGKGAHDLIKDLVLAGGGFATDSSTWRVSADVLQGVATQVGGIGYAPLHCRKQRQAVQPGADTAASGRYRLVMAQ